MDFAYYESSYHYSGSDQQVNIHFYSAPGASKHYQPLPQDLLDEYMDAVFAHEPNTFTEFYVAGRTWVEFLESKKAPADGSYSANRRPYAVTSVIGMPKQ